MEREYDCEETQREIVEENLEYQENQSRSEEDGWFYSDNDASHE